MALRVLSMVRSFSIQKYYFVGHLRSLSSSPVFSQQQTPYLIRENESFEAKKARLLYQSRKRGMLENDLLLSTFAGKFLDTFNAHELEQYDKLINLPSNDWDIYYWATDVKETPSEFQNEIMDLFKRHVKNENREARFRQPDLRS